METVRPAATYARVPSGAAATARVRPGSVTPPIGAFVRVSSSATLDVPVATTSTRASATGASSASRSRQARNGRTRPVNTPDYVQSRSR